MYHRSIEKKITGQRKTCIQSSPVIGGSGQAPHEKGRQRRAGPLPLAKWWLYPVRMKICGLLLVQYVSNGSRLPCKPTCIDFPCASTKPWPMLQSLADGRWAVWDFERWALSLMASSASPLLLLPRSHAPSSMADWRKMWSRSVSSSKFSGSHNSSFREDMSFTPLKGRSESFSEPDMLKRETSLSIGEVDKLQLWSVLSAGSGDKFSKLPPVPSWLFDINPASTWTEDSPEFGTQSSFSGPVSSASDIRFSSPTHWCCSSSKLRWGLKSCS